MAIGESAATAVVHFVLGSAFVLLAAAMFDFGLNRWVTWLGATAAAVFGGTFLLQGVADLTESPPSTGWRSTSSASSSSGSSPMSSTSGSPPCSSPAPPAPAASSAG